MSLLYFLDSMEKVEIVKCIPQTKYIPPTT